MFADRVWLGMLAATGLICGLLLTPGMPVFLTLPAAVLLVLALPGYAATRLLFARRLGLAEKVAMSMGLSFSLAIVGGLLLNLLPEGLSLGPWGGLLGGITVAAAGGAALRSGLGRRPTGPDEATPELAPSAESHGTSRSLRRGSLPRAQVAMLAIAGLLLVGSFGIARLGAAVEAHDPFTQLWMVPNLTGTNLNLGVTNNENRPTAYRLVLTQDGKTIGAWADLTLADGETWSQVVPLSLGRDTHRLQAQLFRAADVAAYRETHADVRYRPNAGRTPAPSLPVDASAMASGVPTGGDSPAPGAP